MGLRSGQERRHDRTPPLSERILQDITGAEPSFQEPDQPTGAAKILNTEARGILTNVNGYVGADLAHPLVDDMQQGLANFFATGDPNPSVKNPFWPAYDTATDMNVLLVTNPTTESGLSKADCDFWDSLTAPPSN